MRKLGPDFGDRKYLETKWINFRFGHGRFVSILLVKVSGLKKWLILWILDSLRRKRDFFFFFVDLDYIYGRLSRIWRVFIRYINYLEILILELNDGQFVNLRSIYEIYWIQWLLDYIDDFVLWSIFNSKEIGDKKYDIHGENLDYINGGFWQIWRVFVTYNNL